jgi:anti-sigma factor RsiW
MRLRRRKPLSCQELVEVVTDYLEGTMSARDRKRFDKHIASCPHCTAYLEQMQITIRTVGRLREDSLDPQMREALLVAFRDWRSHSP